MGLPALVLHTTLQAGLPFRRQTVTFVKFPFEVKFGSFLEWGTCRAPKPHHHHHPIRRNEMSSWGYPFGIRGWGKMGSSFGSAGCGALSWFACFKNRHNFGAHFNTFLLLTIFNLICRVIEQTPGIIIQSTHPLRLWEPVEELHSKCQLMIRYPLKNLNIFQCCKTLHLGLYAHEQPSLWGS